MASLGLNDLISLSESTGNKYIQIKLWDAIIHQWPNFNRLLLKPLLKLDIIRKLHVTEKYICAVPIHAQIQVNLW